jgi:hypothetical protein
MFPNAGDDRLEEHRDSLRALGSGFSGRKLANPGGDLSDNRSRPAEAENEGGVSKVYETERGEPATLTLEETLAMRRTSHQLATVEPVQAVEPEPPAATSIEDVLEEIAKTEAKKQWAIKGLLLRIEESKAQLAKLGWTEDEPAWVAPTAKRSYTKKATAKKTTATKKSKAAGAVKFCPTCNAETPTTRGLEGSFGSRPLKY